MFSFCSEFEHLTEFTTQGQLKNPTVAVTTADLKSLKTRLVPKMLSHSKVGPLNVFKPCMYKFALVKENVDE